MIRVWRNPGGLGLQADNWYFSLGHALRVTKELAHTDPELRGRMFAWWFWRPTFSSNGGDARLGETVDRKVLWLCFWASVTRFPP